MIRPITRKLFLIHAAIAPIELLLRRNPFVVRFANQQLQASFVVFAPWREINLKPLKLLYG